MLNLIKKDLIVQYKMILFGFLYILSMGIAAGQFGMGTLSAGMLMLVYLLVQSPCAYDEQSRSDFLFNSLPIRRRTVVLAKYLTVPLYILIALAEYVLIERLTNLMNYQFRFEPLGLESLLGTLATVSLFVSVYFPVYFRFGYMKTRYLGLVAFFVLIALMGTLAFLVSGGKIVDFMNAMDGFPDVLAGSLILAFAALLFAASYLLSARFYGKRDF